MKQRNKVLTAVALSRMTAVGLFGVSTLDFEQVEAQVEDSGSFDVRTPNRIDEAVEQLQEEARLKEESAAAAIEEPLPDQATLDDLAWTAANDPNYEDYSEDAPQNRIIFKYPDVDVAFPFDPYTGTIDYTLTEDGYILIEGTLVNNTRFKLAHMAIMFTISGPPYSSEMEGLPLVFDYIDLYNVEPLGVATFTCAGRFYENNPPTSISIGLLFGDYYY